MQVLFAGIDFYTGSLYSFAAKQLILLPCRRHFNPSIYTHARTHTRTHALTHAGMHVHACASDTRVLFEDVLKAPEDHTRGILVPWIIFYAVACLVRSRLHRCLLDCNLHASFGDER